MSIESQLLAALELMLEYVQGEREHCPDDYDNSKLDADIATAELAIDRARQAGRDRILEQEHEDRMELLGRPRTLKPVMEDPIDP